MGEAKRRKQAVYRSRLVATLIDRAQDAAIGATLVLVSAVLPVAAWADCTTVGTTVTCDSSAPNPYTNTIGTGPSTLSGTTVTLDTNAQVVVANANAISLASNANITVADGALVKNTAFNTSGLYRVGGNTIEFNSNSTLTVQAGATVYAAGPASNAEAIATTGVGNTIDNYGTIRADNAAVFFSDTFSGSNTIINEAGGVIRGISSTADVIGSYASAVDFTNMGSIVGSLIFSGSSRDQIHIYTGSAITGTIGGGGGNNLMTLNGAGSDSMSGALTNFQTLLKQDTGTWTLTGSIGNSSGPLAVEIQAGTLVLSGDNASFNGTMTVDPAGILQGTSSTLTPAIANNGLVDFVQATDGTYGGTISGTGTVAKDGPGVLTLTGANSYAGGNIFNSGTVAVNADNNLGASDGRLIFNGGTLNTTASFASTRAAMLGASGGTFDVNPGTALTLGGVIDGAGDLAKVDTGMLVLTGANTYTGATTISSGTFALGSGGSIAASSAVNLTGAGATFDISSGGNQTINDLSGVASTTVAVGGSTLAFGTASSTTFDGSFVGSGGLTWQGTGTFTLTGNSDGFTGNTTISSGTFVLGSDSSPNASLGGNVTVAGGLLTGFGAIGGDLINGGVVRPGGSIGTLTVNGNYTQASSGTLAIEVSPVANSQLKVGGAANLGGRLALLYDPGIYTPRTYTLVQAGSVSGAFGLATGTLPTKGLNQEVLISPTSVLLALTTAPLPPVPGALAKPGTPTALATPTTPGTPPVPGVPAGLPGPPGLPAIPGVIEPGTPGAPPDAIEIIDVPAGVTIAVEPTNDTIYSAVTTTAILTAQQANGIILDRLGNRNAGIADGQVAALGGAVPPVQYAQAGNAAVLGGLASALPLSLATQGAWFRGIGGFASLNGNSSAPGFTGETGGFLAGYDRPVAENVYLGVAGGYLHSNIDEHSTSSGTESSARIALYGGMFAGPSLFTATAGYAHDWFDTQRGIADIGTAAQSHGGNEATFAAQWSVPWQTQGFGGGVATLTPKAGFQFVHLSEGSFSEAGASGFDLSSGSRATDSFQPYIAVAAAQKFTTDSGAEITPELRLGYAYEALSNSRLLTVTALDGANFPVSGVKPSRNQLTTGIGVSMVAGPNLSLYANYDATLPTGNTTAQTIQAGLRWRF